MPRGHVDDQVFDSSFGNSLQVVAHRLEVNAGDERRLRLQHVPGLLYERREPVPGLLGLEMNPTQDRGILRIGLWNGGNWVGHRELPRAFGWDARNAGC